MCMLVSMTVIDVDVTQIFKSVPNTPLDIFTLEMNQKFRRFRPAATTTEEAEVAATLEKGTTCRNALLVCILLVLNNKTCLNRNREILYT